MKADAMSATNETSPAAASGAGDPTSSSADTKPPKLWTKNFVIAILVNFLFMLNYFILMVTTADYALKTYTAPTSLAGLSSSIFIIGALVARFFAGSLMERIGRKRMLVLGAGLILVLSLAYFVNFDIWTLLAIRLLHGISYGIASTAIGTISASIIPSERKGEGIGYYALSITLGAAVGPFLGMFLAQHGGPTAFFLADIVVALLGIAFVALLKVKKAEKPAAASPGKTQVAESTIESESETERASAAMAKKHPLISKVIEIGVLPISIVCAIVYFCYSTIVAFLTPYSAELDLQIVASFFFIVYAAAMFVSRPFTGRLFDRKGDKVVIVPAFISFMVGLVIMSQTGSNGFLLLLSAALCGFGVGTIQSSGLAVAVKSTPDARLSLANSTYYILLDVGLGIGPFVLGFFLTGGDYSSMYFAMAFVAFAGLIYYLFARRGKSTRK